jgi:chemotaxis protein MotB
LVVLLAVAAAALGYGLWLHRQTLAAQGRELASLASERQSLSQTNQSLLAQLVQLRDSLGRTEQDRQLLQDEVRRRQAEFERLEQEHRTVTEAHGRLESEMRTALESRDVTISELAGKLTVNILDRVLFASGEAEIKAEGQDVLRKVAQVLGQFPDRQIHVIGHTDNVPIRTARFPSNWELSAARAIAAVRFLTEQAGVDPRRLGALGHGEFHPVAENGSPEGRAQNRRIAIVVLPELLKVPPEEVPAAAVTDAPVAAVGP